MGDWHVRVCRRRVLGKSRRRHRDHGRGRVAAGEPRRRREHGPDVQTAVVHRQLRAGCPWTTHLPKPKLRLGCVGPRKHLCSIPRRARSGGSILEKCFKVEWFSTNGLRMSDRLVLAEMCSSVMHVDCASGPSYPHPRRQERVPAGHGLLTGCSGADGFGSVRLHRHWAAPRFRRYGCGVRAGIEQHAFVGTAMQDGPAGRGPRLSVRFVAEPNPASGFTRPVDACRLGARRNFRRTRAFPPNETAFIRTGQNGFERLKAPLEAQIGRFQVGHVTSKSLKVPIRIRGSTQTSRMTPGVMNQRREVRDCEHIPWPFSTLRSPISDF